MIKKRILSMLALLVTAATGAWADNEPVLLTTITASGDFVSGSKTFDNKATVTFSSTVQFNEGCWYNTESVITLTVTAATGYTITSCTFTSTGWDVETATVNGDSPKVYLFPSNVSTTPSDDDFFGVNVSKIEVYGYSNAPAVAVTGVTLPTTATVTLGDAVALTAAVSPADATDKKVKWSVTSGSDKVKLYKDAECKTEVGTDATDALTVYAKGLAAGDATVKVESNADDTKSATCTVTAKHGTYAVAMKTGLTDGDKWTARADGSGDFAAMPLKGVEGGTKPVELKYGGDLEVKRVTMRVVPAWKGDLSKLSATELESDGVTVLVRNGMTLTGTLSENYKITIADGATVTLDGVTINGANDDNYKWAGISCAGSATINLADGTENTVKGFHSDYPGIHVPMGSTLTIQGGSAGTGKLTANSNGNAAGIGGGKALACGSIIIEGGTVTATGGGTGAGIGAGIGGGEAAACGFITIASTVTKVTATKGADAPKSIGEGFGGYCGAVTIGGTVYYDGDAYLAQAKIIYPSSTVNLSTLTGHYTLQDGDVLTGTLNGNYKITIADGAEVTLDNVNISIYNYSCEWAGLNCAGDATIVLKDGTANTVKGCYENWPGIIVPQNKTVTIKGESEGTGSLMASGNYGAGIGGGYQIACGNINIEGGIITATCTHRAAGIGSGMAAKCGNITISGGTITATGGNNAAGIGGGHASVNPTGCGNITITDGVRVTATKGENAPYSIGMGASSGSPNSCGTVTIGGTVYWGSGAVSGGATYLAKSPLTLINVAGLLLNCEEGQKWSDIINNNPAKLQEAGYYIERKDNQKWLYNSDTFSEITTGDNYSSNTAYFWDSLE